MTATPYLTPTDLRGNPVGKVLDRFNRYEDADLEALVAEFEDVVERECGVAFTPREATETVRGTASSFLFLPHAHISAPTDVTVDGVALSEGEVDDIEVWGPEGILERSAGWFGTQIVLTYTHGYTDTPPAVLRACREFVRAKATKGAGNQPRDAAGPAGVDGTSYPIASSTPTGVREVDRIIATLPHYGIPGIG